MVIPLQALSDEFHALNGNREREAHSRQVRFPCLGYTVSGQRLRDSVYYGHAQVAMTLKEENLWINSRLLLILIEREEKPFFLTNLCSHGHTCSQTFFFKSNTFSLPTHTLEAIWGTETSGQVESGTGPINLTIDCLTTWNAAPFGQIICTWT